jgi:hypothetical protein
MKVLRMWWWGRRNENDALHITHELLKHPFLNFPSALQHSHVNYPGNIIFKISSDCATAVGSNSVESLRKIKLLSVII